MCVCVCHLSLPAVPPLWFDVGEAEVCQAVVAAAVHRSIQTLESYQGKKQEIFSTNQPHFLFGQQI